MQEEKAGSHEQALSIIQRSDIDLSELSGEEYRQKIFDTMGKEADKWLAENAEEFGYIYTKGEI